MNILVLKPEDLIDSEGSLDFNNFKKPMSTLCWSDFIIYFDYYEGVIKILKTRYDMFNAWKEVQSFLLNEFY